MEVRHLPLSHCGSEGGQRPSGTVWPRKSGAHFSSSRNGVAREASDTLGGHIRRACEASVTSHSEKMVHAHREDGRLSLIYSATKLTLGCPYNLDILRLTEHLLKQEKGGFMGTWWGRGNQFSSQVAMLPWLLEKCTKEQKVAWLLRCLRAYLSFPGTLTWEMANASQGS